MIAGLESKISETDIFINESATDFTQLQKLQSSKGQLEKQLEEAMERWVYLNELAETISNK